MVAILLITSVLSYLDRTLVGLMVETATPERRLEELRFGELRWSERDKGWEVLIPAVAFKNAASSFLAVGLYLPTQAVAEYLNKHHRFTFAGQDRIIDGVIYRSAQHPEGKNIVLLGEAAVVRAFASRLHLF